MCCETGKKEQECLQLGDVILHNVTFDFLDNQKSIGMSNFLASLFDSIEPDREWLGEAMQQQFLNNSLQVFNFKDQKINCVENVCCLGCRYSILSTLQYLSQWRSQLEVANKLRQLIQLDACRDETILSGEEDAYLMSHCCHRALVAMYEQVDWCRLKPAHCNQRCHPMHRSVAQIVGKNDDDDHHHLMQCTCFAGYRLQADNRTCADIDECEEKIHTCDTQNERCFNNEGSYRCLARARECAQGHRYNKARQECEGLCAWVICFLSINFMLTKYLAVQLLLLGYIYILL